MNLEIVAVYDLKARAYALPFFVAHVDVAVRGLSMQVNTPGNAMSMHPEDYLLYQLGTWSDEDASIKMLPQPVQVCVAVQLRKAPVVLANPETEAHERFTLAGQSRR